MQKQLTIFFIFLLSSLFLWGLGIPHREEQFLPLEYAVFSAQLLFGAVLWEVMTVLRGIHQDDEAWGQALKWLYILIALLLGPILAQLVASDKCSFRYAGLLLTPVVLGVIGWIVLPRLKNIYDHAKDRGTQTGN